MRSIESLYPELNQKLFGRMAGELPALRKQRYNLINIEPFFHGGAGDERYIYHRGGRTELQFNIGYEETEEGTNFRHGVAFSVKSGHGIDLSIFAPKIARFNKFMEDHADDFQDFKMWHHPIGKSREGDFDPGIIPPERQTGFIFLGKRQPAKDPIDVETLLDDFDRLMPIYRYVERFDVSPNPVPYEKQLRLEAGNGTRVGGGTVRMVAREYERAKRHSDIQNALYDYLKARYPGQIVGAEKQCVDLHVDFGDKYWLYEIKTAWTAKKCICEAMGQLLQYAYWPDREGPERLIIVGEPALTEDAAKYMAGLRKRFSLNIYYQKFDTENKILEENW